MIKSDRAPVSEITLTAVLADKFSSDPDDLIFSLVSADGNIHDVTNEVLQGRVFDFAARFGAAGNERKIVIICLYNCVDLYAAFLGAVWSGHIPTLLSPPSPRMEAGKYHAGLDSMLSTIAAGLLVTDRDIVARLEFEDRLRTSEAEIVYVDDVSAGPPTPFWPADADDVLLLQHSSGTTGSQKGVALSHRAVMAHNQAYGRRIGLTPDDRVVSWLPLYHDMGLIACFLFPFVGGAPFLSISPFDWVTNPVRLFDVISHVKATLCWMPNFAFSFMTESILDSQLRDDLDLRSIRAWINSSEPVFATSLEAFVRRFARLGVRAEQLTSSYAMAENVYAVSQSLPGRQSVLGIDRRIFIDQHRIVPVAGNDAMALVSNGPVVDGTEVATLDDADQILGPGYVGQLAIRGDYLFSGYFRREDETARAMTADGWFRTGDLGFVHDGELYVTGRLKDLVIVQGRNFYPGDIEAVVGRIDCVVSGRVVAFGVPDEFLGTEKLVILAEETDSPINSSNETVREIRRRVAQELDCVPGVVRIVPARWIVKSTSGKLARSENSEKYLRQFV